MRTDSRGRVNQSLTYCNIHSHFHFHENAVIHTNTLVPQGHVYIHNNEIRTNAFLTAVIHSVAIVNEMQVV